MIAKIEIPEFKDNIDIDFARMLKKIRANLGIKQSDMAVFFNVTTSSYQKWELGEVTPNGNVGFWLGQNYEWIERLAE